MQRGGTVHRPHPPALACGAACARGGSASRRRSRVGERPASWRLPRGCGANASAARKVRRPTGRACSAQPRSGGCGARRQRRPCVKRRSAILSSAPNARRRPEARQRAGGRVGHRAVSTPHPRARRDSCYEAQRIFAARCRELGAASVSALTSAPRSRPRRERGRCCCAASIRCPRASRALRTAPGNGRRDPGGRREPPRRAHGRRRGGARGDSRPGAVTG